MATELSVRKALLSIVVSFKLYTANRESVFDDEEEEES